MQDNVQLIYYILKESNLINTNITAPAPVLASCLRERSVPRVCIIYFCNIHSCWPPAAAPLHRWLGFSTFSIIIKVQVLFCSTLKKYWLLAVGWLGGHRGQSQTPFNKSIKSPAPPAANPLLLELATQQQAGSQPPAILLRSPQLLGDGCTYSTLAN